MENNKTNKILLICVAVLFVGLAALYVLHFTGNSGSNSKVNAKAKAPVMTKDGLKIAYVNVDTLNAKYEYIKDLEKDLNAFKQGKENSLKQQAEKLQADGKKLQADYQNYLQNGANMTLTEQQNKESELKKRENELNQRAEKLARLEQEYTAQILERQTNENKKMINAVYAFIREYNADNQQFNLIFAKTGSELPIILYGDEGMDITEEIVNGLNEEYKKLKSEKE